MPKARSQAAFTLIELLIVIAIIGILAAVLVPNLLGARSSAVFKAGQLHSSTVHRVLASALATNVYKTAVEVLAEAGAANCMTASPASFVADYGVGYPAPPDGVTSCTTSVVGDEFNVTVSASSAGIVKTYVSGAPQ